MLLTQFKPAVTILAADTSTENWHFYFDFLAYKSELTMCVYDDSTECHWLYESLINLNTFKNIKKILNSCWFGIK